MKWYSLLVGCALGLGACGREAKPLDANQNTYRNMVVLGIDGLDPDLLQEALNRFPERMTNFRTLIEQGSGIQRLGTSTPPQSPVAWSNFITGMNPGGHGIFDFIHRDPTSYREAPGTQKLHESSDLNVPGPWKFPLTQAGDSNRSGRAFWTQLADAGVPASVWRMPINFPVEAGKGLSFSGMMTPAVDSAYGQPTLYTTQPPIDRIADPKVQRIDVRNGRVRTHLSGPSNPFRDGEPHVEVPLDLLVDAEGGALALQLQGQDLVLTPGQWSRFLPVRFDLLPLGAQSMSGIVRFYLRSIEPELELYASPVNIDPTNPVAPVSQPEGASEALAESIGLYYTQGMAEDVNGLKKGLLQDSEFMAQSGLVLQERNRMLEYALDRYAEESQGGLLFFYYSTVDLCAHMMWRLADPQHPSYDPILAAQNSTVWSGRAGSTWQEVLMDLYLKMDQALGEIRARVGPDTLILVMSDHGFAPYYRIFSLNTWLWQHGYLVFLEGKGPERDPEDPDFVPVPLAGSIDWTKSRAYGMGFNGLYLNLRGREAQGIVEPGAEAESLLSKLKAELEAIRDEAPERRGVQVILEAQLASKVYHGQRMAEAPDLVVGFNAGYGNSDESSLGRVPYAVLRDNLGGTFNGNHLMHASVVEGTLLTNGTLLRSDLRLEDVTAEIFHQYDVQPDQPLDGRPFLK